MWPSSARPCAASAPPTWCCSATAGAPRTTPTSPASAPRWRASSATARPAARCSQIGAGGAGLATASALLDLGFDPVVVHDVVPAAVAAMVDRFAGALRGSGGSLDAWLPRADGVVHVTPVGMAEHPGVAFDVDRLGPGAWVAEVVYRPLETELLRRARARGQRTLDGGGMAVGQAVESLRLITGLDPDVDRMHTHFNQLVTRGLTCADPSLPSASAAAWRTSSTPAPTPGFDGVEIFEQDLVVNDRSPEEIRALADRLGLSLDLYQPFRDFEGVTPDLLEENLRRAAGSSRPCAVSASARCWSAATWPRPPVGSDQVAAEQLRRLGDLAASFGIRVAYEALAWGRYVDDYRRSWRIAQLADHDARRRLPRQLPHPVPRARPRRHRGHPRREDLLRPARRRTRPHHGRALLEPAPPAVPGGGRVDLGRFVTHLLRAGYTGPLSLEVFNDVFRQTDTGRTAEHALRSLVWLEDRAARLLADGARPPTAATGPASTGSPTSTCPPGTTTWRSRPRTPAASRCCSTSSA